MSSRQLDQKVAIITGGDSGIGKAIALAFAAAGAKVAINYHQNHDAAQDVIAQITQGGGTAFALQGNVAEVSALRALVARTVQEFGQLDVMVNNAGEETRTSLLDTTEADFDAVIGVDLKGAFFGMQVAAKQMIAQGHGGRIITISSVHETWPMPGNTPYCCAKGGVRMLTRTAGVELSPHGILVANIGPGAVVTPINAGTLANPATAAALTQAIPVGHVAEPAESAFSGVARLRPEHLCDGDDLLHRWRTHAGKRWSVSGRAQVRIGVVGIAKASR